MLYKVFTWLGIMKINITDIKDSINLAVFYKKSNSVRYTYGKNYGVVLMTMVDHAWWWGEVDSYRLGVPHPKGGDVECFMDRGIPVFVCSIAVLADEYNIRLVPYTESIWVMNVTQTPSLLKYCHGYTDPIVLAAVAVDPSAIKDIKQSEALMLACIDVNPRCYRWVKTPTQEMTELAITRCPTIINEVSPNRDMLELIGIRYEDSVLSTPVIRPVSATRSRSDSAKSEVHVMVEDIHTAMELSNKDLLETVSMTIDFKYDAGGGKWASVFMDGEKFILWKHKVYRMYLYFEDDHIIPIEACSSVKAKWFEEPGRARSHYDCYFKVESVKTDPRHRVVCYCELNTNKIEYYFDHIGVFKCQFEFDVILKGSGRHSVFTYAIKYETVKPRTMMWKKRLQRYYEELSPSTRWLLGGAARVSKGVVVTLKKILV